MSTLEVRGLWHRYADADTPALRGASVAVADGEMVSVVGPSGSGKSTLLRVAAGLLRSTSGQVLVDGRDVADQPTERRDLTVMFQHPLLFEHLDVAGNIAFAPRLAGSGRREARRCAQRYLRLVHLEGLDSRDVASLSGGQQQRVALARALAAERGALLLDEPFSSLDRELRASMHDLLAEVRAALAPTILMVTHDLDEAALAESTVVLVDGSVHQHAPMAEVYQRPATVAVARLLGGFTEVAGTVRDGAHHSAWGRLPVAAEAAGDGAAVLLVRREALRIEPADGGTTGTGLEAHVVRRRPTGTRVVLSLMGSDDSRMEVELPIGEDVGPGTRVRVLPPDGRSSLWAVRGVTSGGNAQGISSGSHDSPYVARTPLKETRS
ncbi:ABC transporter ATP-binding protein [Nocardioides sp. AX2bis]|uniref:ABC transporter ATP-binding protein n=1 Tax=Nocardioides sp. AX2bis TaxID=2653157 RepID=UPI0012F33DA5|nr:ABC transporter ATP-binding protein [Nocardioides sp. AX2bis]VXB09040.1 Putative spermidine/putrescine transport system ATP-binding protein/thiamine transport system ATP-binding protein [Nocardioides sp. AX2bis]